MDFDQWDRTAAYLQALEYQAKMMEHHGAEMENILGMMNQRPTFKTWPEAEMERLRKRLKDLMFALTQAQARYEKLPQTA